MNQINDTRNLIDDFLSFSQTLSHLGDLRLAETENGYLGLVPPLVKAGDIVCILKGSRNPSLLRPAGDHHLFVGNCFMLGLMHEEVQQYLDAVKAKVETFEIR